MHIHLRVLLTALLIAVPLNAQKPRPPKQANQQSALTAREIAKKAIPSVVLLVTKDAQGKPTKLGSGFFVDRYTVVTNYHVIKGASSAYAKPGNVDYEDEVLGTIGIDNENDLALLKIDTLSAGLVTDQRGQAYGPWHPPLTLAKTYRPEVGDEIYVVGNPEGLEGTFSPGIVSALRGDDYIQITAPISHGSSGGPVLNKYGAVIGIAVGAIEEGQNLNFAIPVTKLLALMNHAAATVTPLRRNQATVDSTAPEKKAPTREETASWLKGKLEGVAAYLSSSSSAGYHSRIERLDFSIGNCFMDLTLTGEINSTRIVNKYSPSLELVESAWSGRNKDGDWAVWLSFTKAVYQFNEVYDRGRLIQKNEEKTNTVPLFTGDEELANRAATAFNHLIKLCGGGKKEPF